VDFSAISRFIPSHESENAFPFVQRRPLGGAAGSDGGRDSSGPESPVIRGGNQRRLISFDRAIARCVGGISRRGPKERTASKES
jgi:hypothetical protein